MKNNVHFSSQSNEWETPDYVFKHVEKLYGKFDLDAAATKENAKCEKFFTKEDDALSKDWAKEGKNIWVNPPYGREIGKFVEKAYQEGRKVSVVMLIPARTDTKWWHKYCSMGEVHFIRGRLKFVNRTLPSYREDGNFKTSSAAFPSAVVAFSPRLFRASYYIDIKGVVSELASNQ